MATVFEIPDDISAQAWDNWGDPIQSWWDIVQRFRPEMFVQLATALEAIAGIVGTPEERQIMAREYREKALRRLKDSGIGETLEEIGLRASLVSFNRLLALYEMPGTTHRKQIRLAQELQGRISDEMRGEMFFALTGSEAKRFKRWAEGWEGIIARFPDCTRDIEEMQKCFAVGRYTASMFHALHVAEWGAIYLGDHIGVTDPKKSWGATERKLREMVKAGHSLFSVTAGCTFEFVEQMHREVESMMLAWRHKVDHAVNHLAIVPNTDFTPDVSEHIIGAVRVFMLRLDDGIQV